MRLSWKGLPIARNWNLTLALALAWLLAITVVALTYHWWPLAFKSTDLQPASAYVAPFQSAHLLGTDHLGRDVWYYSMHATQTAWLLAFPPLLVSTLLGVTLGCMAGWFGNYKLTISLKTIIAMALPLLTWFFLKEFYLWRVFPLFSSIGFKHTFSWMLAGGLLVLEWAVLSFLFKPVSFFKRKVTVPLDSIFKSLVEIWSTLPKLLLLLLLSAFTEPSLENLAFWIAITYWVIPARLSRTKVRLVQKQPFIEAALATGMGTSRILLYHIWPTLRGAVLTNFCFAASGLLGIGSTLAFLGIGIPPEIPSWGKMLSAARFSVDAWWLLMAPALFLLLSIFSLQALWYHLSSKKEQQ
ncbi:ABC transporter permease [Rufibacter sp. LB8]|nr:ABC transporter permease subunit [Rufibacter sp. LB8]